MAELEKLEGLNNLAEISLVNNPVSTGPAQLFTFKWIYWLLLILSQLLLQP